LCSEIVHAEVLISDDQFKPDVGKQLFEKNVKRDHVDFMTGVVFSNIMLAALPEAFDNNTIYISANAAPSSLAGKDCNPLFYAVSWPNDAYHEAAGEFARLIEVLEVMVVHAEDPLERVGLLHRIAMLFESRLEQHLEAFNAYARALREDNGNEQTLAHLERLADAVGRPFNRPT